MTEATVKQPETVKKTLYVTPNLSIDFEKYLQQSAVTFIASIAPRPRLDQNLYRVVVEIPKGDDHTDQPLEYNEKVSTKPHGLYAQPGVLIYHGLTKYILSCELIRPAKLSVDNKIPKYVVTVSVENESFFDDLRWPQSDEVKQAIQHYAPAWHHSAYVVGSRKTKTYVISYVPTIVDMARVEDFFEQALEQVAEAALKLGECITDFADSEEAVDDGPINPGT